MFKRLYIFLFLIAQHVNYCQIKSDSTNIDSYFLTSELPLEYLKANQFNDGKGLIIVRNTSEWNSLYSKRDEPACYIHKVGDYEYYFYNWFAIVSSDQLLPKGYLLVTQKDIERWSNANWSSNSIWKKGLSCRETTNETAKGKDIYIDKEGKLNFKNIGSIEWNYSNSEYSIQSEQYFWINQSKKDEYGDAVAMVDGSSPRLNFSKRFNGLPVICILNVFDFYKDSVFSYKALLPNKYKEFMGSIINLINKEKTIDFKNFQLKGQLKFTNAGINISDKIKISEGSYSQNQHLTDKVQSMVSNFKEYPIYNGKAVNAATNFNIKVNSLVEFEKYSYVSISENLPSLPYSITSSLTENSSYIKRCKYQKTKVIMPDENTNSVFQSKIISVKFKGPLYSLYSFIPGLGLAKINKGNVSFNKLKMWHFTAGISGLTLASLIYSRYNYDLYRKSSGEKEIYYSRANTTHKTALIGGMLYATLFITDFTLTLKKGLSNKRHQMRINNSLTDYYNTQTEINFTKAEPKVEAKEVPVRSLANVFTPNGDKQNDTFNLIYSDVLHINLFIYDRSGKVVYKYMGDNGYVVWDGKNLEGVDCPNGVYFYTVEIKDKKGKEFNEKGNVSLYR